jgi:molybdopterin-synthase adenylyltransferase
MRSAMMARALSAPFGRIASLALQLPCLHIGFSPDGLYGSGLWEPHYQVLQEVPGDPCDYPLTRPLALMLTALAARVICDFFSKGQSNNFELTWNDLRIGYMP